MCSTLLGQCSAVHTCYGEAWEAAKGLTRHVAKQACMQKKAKTAWLRVGLAGHAVRARGTSMQVTLKKSVSERPALTYSLQCAAVRFSGKLLPNAHQKLRDKTFSSTWFSLIKRQNADPKTRKNLP